MSKEKRARGDVVSLTEGARMASGGRPMAGGHTGPLKKG